MGGGRRAADRPGEATVAYGVGVGCEPDRVDAGQDPAAGGSCYAPGPKCEI